MGSKVLIERLSGIKHYAGITLKGDMESVEKMFSHTAEDLGSADLMLYMGFNKPYVKSGGGIGYVGAVCLESEEYIENKFSINCYGTSYSAMGELLAHEIGHNLGMEHDHDEIHGDEGGPCDGKGIMSYGEHLSEWSDCSVKDFTAHYTLYKSNWCLPGMYLKVIYFCFNMNKDGHHFKICISRYIRRYFKTKMRFYH